MKTLHKSNAVPIRKDSNDAKDQANMRKIMRDFRIYAGKYQLSKQLGGKEVPAIRACIMQK